jgi:hypothetical protein
MEAIPFILFILVWIFLYKYLVNKKQKGKIVSHLLSFMAATVVMFLSIIPIAPELTTEQKAQIVEDKKIEQPKKQEIEKENLNTEKLVKSIDSLPNTSIYQIISPEYTFAQFLNAWATKNYDVMSNYTQLRWRYRESNPAEAIKNMYDLKDLKGAKIIKSEGNSSAFKITANIFYINTMNDKKYNVLITAMVIKEDNQWGVNPISALAEKDN